MLLRGLDDYIVGFNRQGFRSQGEGATGPFVFAGIHMGWAGVVLVVDARAVLPCG